jgi:glycosyltransferase involved in cell wall biosynthesis
MSNRFSLLREGAFALVGRLLGWKVCVTWHSSSGLRARSVLSLLPLRLALAPAHVVHVLSDAHASAAPVAIARLVVIPNDVRVPLDPEPMETRRPAVVFAGEFGHRKGADVLLGAWQALPPEVKADWTLEVFGRVAPALVRTIAEFGDGSLRVHGLTDADVVNRALLSSSIAVLPSRAEALPMFLLEAMAAGCAVVATDVGAVRSLVGETGGLLVEPGDPRALASGLASLMTSPELRARLALAARHRVVHDYAERPVTARWRILYSGLLQRPRRDREGHCRTAVTKAAVPARDRTLKFRPPW